jgi:hypothetical protein
MRKLLRLEFARHGARNLGRERFDHADIIACLEALGRDQRAHAHLVQCVFRFRQPIGRIDVNENETGLGRRELRQRPFGAIGRPDADAVARLESECDECGRQRLDAFA